jgi:hypothetical protein
MRFHITSPNLYSILMNKAGDGEGAGGGDDGGKGAGEGGKTGTEGGKNGTEGGEGGKKEDTDPLTLDINKAIEKARSQEKAKLYSQIEDLKKTSKTAEELATARDTENKTLKQRLADAEAKLKELDGGGEGGDDGKKKGKKTIDEETLNKTIEATVNITAKKFQDALDAANKRVEELEKQNTTREIDTYKNQLISENKDVIIPELVTGSTREELDLSLITAKQVFANVAKRLNPKGGDGNGEQRKDDAAPASKLILPPVPNVNGGQSPGTPRIVEVKALSDKDYKQSRNEILRAAAAEARKSLIEG